MPTLEQFTRYANRHSRMFAGPIRSINDDRRTAFVTETAFELAAGRSGSAHGAEDRARQALAMMPDGQPATPRLTSAETAEARLLAANLSAYISTLPSAPTYRPVIPGCGVVHQTEADVLAGSHLVEVKAVRRGFRGSDFRQVITYCAMLNAVGQSVTDISLVNPRSGLYFHSSAVGLALDVGAASWVELLQDLAYAMDGLRLSDV